MSLRQSLQALQGQRRLPRRATVLIALSIGLIGSLGLIGCSMEFKGQPTDYKLAASTLEILQGNEQAQEALETELQRLFGTQAEPALPGRASKLAPAAALYARKCLHCHGNEGGGDGMTSFTLTPSPRDFRRGLFKFNNIAGGGRPELTDLVRVITSGINGTGMPSLKELSTAEREGLAEYVRYLSMRGEVEAWLAAEYVPGAPITAADADEVYGEIRVFWLEEPRERVVAPSAMPVVSEGSIRRGAQLFHDATGAACANCHGTGGRGGGPAAWGFTEESPDKVVPLLRDSWGREATPRELVSEILHHGDSPGALFERIYLGIDGTPMAGIGEVSGADGTPLFSSEDLWSLVHYVRAIRGSEWESLTGELGREASK